MRKIRLNSASEVVKYSGLIFFANFAGAIILFVSNILISQRFDPQTFGNFKTILSLALFLPALIELGAGVTIVKYTVEFINNKKKINHLIKWILKLRVALYLTLLALIFILRDQISTYLLKDASLSHLVIPGILITGLCFFEIFKSVALGLKAYKDYSMSRFLTYASSGILMLVFGYFFGVYYALIGWALSYLIGNLPLIKLSINKGILDETEEIDVKKIFSDYSLPMYILYFPSLLSAAAIPILSLFFSQTIIGYYSFAMIFFNGIILIPSSLSDFLFPKISGLTGKENKKTADEHLKRVLFLYSIVVIPGIIATVFFSDIFIKMIASSYVPSLLAFKTLVSLGLLSGYLLIYGSYLQGLAKLKDFAVITIIHNVVFLAVSFFVLGLLT